LAFEHLGLIRHSNFEFSFAFFGICVILFVM